MNITQCADLAEVRTNIDRIDSQLIALIAERGHYVRQAAAFKADERAVRDPARVEKVIARVRVAARDAGAEPDLVEAVWRTMIGQFITLEMKEHQAH